MTKISPIKVQTLREGASLLGGVVKTIDSGTDGDKRVSMREVSEFLTNNGAEIATVSRTALNRMFAYVTAKYGSDEVSLTQFNRGLSDAVKALAKAAKKDEVDDSLSAAEKKSLAKTWKAVADFAAEYKGASVEEVLGLHYPV
jgi:hypothetical protein